MVWPKRSSSVPPREQAPELALGNMDKTPKRSQDGTITMDMSEMTAKYQLAMQQGVKYGSDVFRALKLAEGGFLTPEKEFLIIGIKALKEVLASKSELCTEADIACLESVGDRLSQLLSEVEKRDSPLIGYGFPGAIGSLHQSQINADSSRILQRSENPSGTNRLISFEDSVDNAMDPLEKFATPTTDVMSPPHGNSSKQGSDMQTVERVGVERGGYARNYQVPESNKRNKSHRDDKSSRNASKESHREKHKISQKGRKKLVYSDSESYDIDSSDEERDYEEEHQNSRSNRKEKNSKSARDTGRHSKHSLHYKKIRDSSYDKHDKRRKLRVYSSESNDSEYYSDDSEDSRYTSDERQKDHGRKSNRLDKKESRKDKKKREQSEESDHSIRNDRRKRREKPRKRSEERDRYERKSRCTLPQTLALIQPFEGDAEDLNRFSVDARYIRDQHKSEPKSNILRAIGSKLKGRASQAFLSQINQYESVGRFLDDLKAQFGTTGGLASVKAEMRVIRQERNEKAAAYGHRVQKMYNKLLSAYDTDQDLEKWEKRRCKTHSENQAWQNRDPDRADHGNSSPPFPHTTDSHHEISRPDRRN
ncbi:hypothetical protein QAD02_005027 [Eretmocerus hayati]|uniref:Uncharacterized protein n=2 Tax=Eretmocerus hayati TaxID=131215 RepID=A0ACC2NR68_9HYME|nr:hypothetical protein QAD02_002731 [Eretmocerus hayati]KAJ8673765.1 hypothetical protein QAD02_005027 [Eretmocerus hayati]